MSDAPVDLRQPVFSQEGVCLGEMLAAEESPIGRTRRWMRRRQDQMFTGVYQGTFRFGITSPQHKYQVLPLVAQSLYHGIGKSLPAVVAVRTRFLTVSTEFMEKTPCSTQRSRLPDAGTGLSKS